ncbi:hypothetical protein F4825DRAFT_300866 [Nemania diffusa]|nr:hypothetical protein F4825DRAFT_300866 [Nemania diffusa]
MHSNNILLPMAALASGSLAQSLSPASCSAIVDYFRSAAPTYAAALSPYLDVPLNSRVQTASTATITLPPNTLEDPEGYVELLCSIADELPSSLLPDFQDWGSELLSYGSVHISSYDAYVTECVTTGPAASSITSYLNSILTGTGGLCQPTATPSGASNGTAVTTPATTPAPTATGTNSTTTAATSVVTGAAARPTGAIIGAAAIGGLLGAVALL